MTKNAKNRPFLFGTIALALLFAFSAQTAQAQGFNPSSKQQPGPAKVSNDWGNKGPNNNSPSFGQKAPNFAQKTPNFGQNSGQHNHPGTFQLHDKVPQHHATKPQINHQPHFNPAPAHHHASAPCPPQVVVVGRPKPTLLEKIVDIFR